MRRVAVTGFGVVSPIGVGGDAFWDSLEAGRSGIGRISRFDCTTFAAQLAAEVKTSLDVPGEIAEVAAQDPKVGFAYAACAEALTDAGMRGLTRDCLLHLGTSLEVFDLSRVIRQGQPDFRGVFDRPSGNKRLGFQMPLDTAAAMIAETLGAPGQSLTNCSACAAGAQAIGHGFRNVRRGKWEIAVCGGFDSLINPLGVGGFQLLGALTTDNERGETACRPFDASRSGVVLGEGAAVFVLEPLEKAVAEGRRVFTPRRSGCPASPDCKKAIFRETPLPMILGSVDKVFVESVSQNRGAVALGGSSGNGESPEFGPFPPVMGLRCT